MPFTPLSITRLAPAKINLTLDVLNRRDDGYHEIRSVMQAITLADRLTITLTPDSPGVSLDVIGPESAGVPSDATNIVHKAAVRLQKTAAARGQLPGNASGLHITLAKNIPSQAGLGGGSSDAAAALLAVNELFGLELSQTRLASIAETLGADVSFFLTGGTALVEGLGERVRPLLHLSPPWPLVIVKPPVGVSTPWAYGALDAMTDRVSGTATKTWITGTQKHLGNDFHAPVVNAFPEIATVVAALSDAKFPIDEYGPLLCGSGACVFRRMESLARAEELAKSIRAMEIGNVWIAETLG